MQLKKTSTMYRLVMAGAMIVVGLNIWLTTHELGALFSAQGWRAHTLEVITHTKALELEVSKANSAVRGYLLEGSPIFAQRYDAATKQTQVEIDQIQRLSPTTIRSRNESRTCAAVVRAKFAALDTGVAMRKGAAGPLDEALLSHVMADSPDSGPTVGYVISQIEGEEGRLLDERTAETQHARAAVWASFIGASLLDILLIIAAFEFLIRITRDRYVLAERAKVISMLVDDLKLANTSLEERVALRTRELESSNQELEAFSYSVSHDLRAPLRTIDGFSLALQEDFSDILNDEGRDYIARVRNGVQRMGQLIDALLQLSRVTRSDIVARAARSLAACHPGLQRNQGRRSGARCDIPRPAGCSGGRRPAPVADRARKPDRQRVQVHLEDFGRPHRVRQ